MTARLFIATLGVALCALAGSASAGRLARTGGELAVGRVYVAAEGCRGHRFMPRKVILACGDGNLYVTGLGYRSYDGRQARAKGVFHLNDCRPNCAGGRFHTHGGTIRFFDVVRCADGRRYFARARYSFKGHDGSGTAEIEPEMRCHKR
jgi:hypothetical protein